MSEGAEGPRANNSFAKQSVLRTSGAKPREATTSNRDKRWQEGEERTFLTRGGTTTMLGGRRPTTVKQDGSLRGEASLNICFLLLFYEKVELTGVRFCYFCKQK